MLSVETVNQTLPLEYESTLGGKKTAFELGDKPEMPVLDEEDRLNLIT